MSQGEPSGDTRLIAQLMQQLQAQQLNIGMLEAERGNVVAASNGAEGIPSSPARRLSPQPPPQPPPQAPSQQQQQGSPRPSGSPLPASQSADPQRRTGDRPPKARPASTDDRRQRQQKQQPQSQQHQLDGSEPTSGPASPAAKARVPKGKAPRRIAKAPSPAPSSVAEGEDDASGVTSSIPWNEFAEDGEGDTVFPADAEEAEEMERRRAARDETRFNSISDELRAINQGIIDPNEASTVAPIDTRQPCAHCGRKFLPERLGRHIKVCEDLKRGKEWRGTWKSPHTTDMLSQKQLLTSSFKI